MSWFWRGAQSAAFYYLSCTPWFSYLHERKRGRERDQARAAKGFEHVEAGIYEHPLPADTNPYWNEEMLMGPGLKRGRVSKDKAKSESTKRLNTGGQDSSAGEGSTLTFPSLDVPEEFDIMNDNWNKKKYQRPDEHLWGSDDPNCGSYASLSSRAANKPLVSGDGAYYNARNPAVSELHPPVISNRPKHASQALWMTQPPPPAKIMEGKERADKSRSVSNASYGSARGTGGAMAGRQASLRRLTNRYQDGIPDDMDPSPPEDDGENVNDFERQRNRATSDPVNPDMNKRRKPPHIQTSPYNSNQVNSRATASTINRPALSTVVSANGQDLSKLQVSGKPPKTLSTASSLQALQGLDSEVHVIGQRRALSSTPSKSAQNTRLPLQTELEDQPSTYNFPAARSPEKKYISKDHDEDSYKPIYRWSMDV